jgi:hypothetical protein
MKLHRWCAPVVALVLGLALPSVAWAVQPGSVTPVLNSTPGTGACETGPQTATCSNGWYKLVAHASGPGGRAENDGATKIVHVWHTLTLLRLSGGSPEWPPLCTTVIPDEGLTM